MNIPEDELTPERCRELRQGRALKVMINLFHAHTIEPHNQSEADFDPEQFLQNYNQHSDLRKRLADRIGRIIVRAAETESEIQILRALDYVRGCTAWFYGAFSNDNQYRDIGGVPASILDSVTALTNFAADPTLRPIVQEFGGVFVILDLIRAQARLFTRNREIVDLPSHYRLMERALVTLNHLMMTEPLPHEEIRRMLGNCRSFHEQLVTIIRRAHRDNELEIVQVCCDIMLVLFLDLPNPLTFYRDGYMVSCGVIRCLVELLPQTADPETVHTMLESLSQLIVQDHRNVMEFCSIDGSFGALIDILTPNAVKDADVENAQVYQKQKECAGRLFRQIFDHLDHQVHHHREDGRLLGILVERDIALVLFPHIDEQTKIRRLFNTIIHNSDDQAQKIEQLRRRQH